MVTHFSTDLVLTMIGPSDLKNYSDDDDGMDIEQPCECLSLSKWMFMEPSNVQSLELTSSSSV